MVVVFFCKHLTIVFAVSMDKPLLRLMQLPHLATETHVFISIASLFMRAVVGQGIVV